uniref:Uncharacterized protein ycf35 n=1 Tax=Dichotomaria marginata TaxID=268567 RepID=A0A1G4NSB8_9FLOR|nr:Hypothetical protein ycf35 [Dichotomaria marginata]SCW21456.1 Hypothetical protein ycf35 [Dichotomaria marginata]
MSHLSKIKTRIKNQDILIQSLKELNIHHNLTYESNKLKPTIYVSIKNRKKDIILPHFIWNNHNYEFIADSKTWFEKNKLDALIEKLNQQYAYNTIIKKSHEKGFTHTNSNILQDGSIQLVLERWT